MNKIDYKELEVGDVYILDDVKYEVVDVIENDGQKSIVSVTVDD